MRIEDIATATHGQRAVDVDAATDAARDMIDSVELP